jgi:hypothetical protein
MLASTAGHAAKRLTSLDLRGSFFNKVLAALRV